MFNLSHPMQNGGPPLPFHAGHGVLNCWNAAILQIQIRVSNAPLGCWLFACHQPAHTHTYGRLLSNSFRHMSLKQSVHCFGQLWLLTGASFSMRLGGQGGKTTGVLSASCLSSPKSGCFCDFGFSGLLRWDASGGRVWGECSATQVGADANHETRGSNERKLFRDGLRGAQSQA